MTKNFYQRLRNYYLACRHGNPVDRAVLLWETKNGRHRVLYDAGEAEGLNLHPHQSTERT